MVNPVQKILPRIARITHITDEMVADQPGSEEAVRRFADFAVDCVLVGRNIKQSDLHYINAASRRTGVRLENPFFDTYRFARTLKEAQGWESVKLEYLSRVFGIDQPDAHRAWCDAQANALLYRKLKELARQKGEAPGAVCACSWSHILACSFSSSAVFRNRAAICSNSSFWALEAKEAGVLVWRNFPRLRRNHPCISRKNIV